MSTDNDTGNVGLFVEHSKLTPLGIALGGVILLCTGLMPLLFSDRVFVFDLVLAAIVLTAAAIKYVRKKRQAKTGEEA